MRYRQFGATDLKVSEIGFGTWGIGGKSYGAADRQESLRALARAQELGCNFIDTAAVYGDAEDIVAQFLAGRRQRWIVATKYSGQKRGILRTVEDQLRRLKIETLDLYQLHWAPRQDEMHLYEDLYRLKRSGKVRYLGVSLYDERDIDFVLDQTGIDAIQVAFSLLDPDPYLARLEKIRRKNVGVIVRSCLKSGFLTGRYDADTTFPDPQDQRHAWSRDEIVRLVDATEKFRFLEKETGSLLVAAARYPLSFPQTSTVLLGTKTAAQADVNFGSVSGDGLSAEAMALIQQLQKQLRLRPGPATSALRRVWQRLRQGLNSG